MHRGLHHLQIARIQLAKGVGGIHQPLKAGGADHQTPGGHQGGPDLFEHLPERATHLEQHPVGLRRQLGEIVRRIAGMNVQIADAEATAIVLQQFDRIGIALEGVNRPSGHQPGDLQSQGTGTATHIPHQGIRPRTQVGQQHHPQLHRRGAEAGCVSEDGIRQAGRHEIPAEGAIAGRTHRPARHATTLTVSAICPGHSRCCRCNQSARAASIRSPGISSGMPGG